MITFGKPLSDWRFALSVIIDPIDIKAFKP